MKTISLKNVDILHFNYKRLNFYGASQSMYSGYIKKLSGCGPTVASNIFAYISKTDEEYKKLYQYDVINSENMKNYMLNIWKYITPSSRGVDKTSIFESGINKYFKELGLENQIKPVVYDVIYSDKKTKNHVEIREFLKGFIDNNIPVAFLNKDNGEVANLQKWHWLLIVGITYDENELYAIIYDEGRKINVNLKQFLETTKMDGGFVGFKKTPTAYD